MEENKVKSQMASLKLQHLFKWSDRVGSDEIIEINEVIKLLKTEYNDNRNIRKKSGKDTVCKIKQILIKEKII